MKHTQQIILAKTFTVLDGTAEKKKVNKTLPNLQMLTLNVLLGEWSSLSSSLDLNYLSIQSFDKQA